MDECKPLPMGKIIQLVFALVAPGAIVTNLMAGACTSSR